ncbi:hypothetical protein JTE90_011356 [Oedothorax gibbosus]|uniref:Uncharacterized protein n=1 Tax=Oedothorax gibbosus TaxID=931172 RepID=A0AAV6VNV0_9ARAC|nr:hypothetical protein JTE90_011356 [Oedothorax gibbosus]
MPARFDTPRGNFGNGCTMPPAWGYQHQPPFLKWKTWAQPTRPAQNMSVCILFCLLNSPFGQSMFRACHDKQLKSPVSRSQSSVTMGLCVYRSLRNTSPHPRIMVVYQQLANNPHFKARMTSSGSRANLNGLGIVVNVERCILEIW